MGSKDSNRFCPLAWPLVALGLAATLAACGSSSDDPPQVAEPLPMAPGDWTRFVPVETEIDGRLFKPTCSGFPGTHSEFHFWAKRGTADKLVVVTDFGLVTAGSFDGQNGVFVFDLVSGAGEVQFLATSPTDSSTLLAPVLASQLGLAEGQAISYQVASFDLLSDLADEMPGSAVYDPWTKALSTDGAFVEVGRNDRARLDITADLEAYRAQQPLGLMAVVLDNATGADEALLLPAR